MAKDKLTEYSATNASNDVIGDISVAEGMLPSAVNNALREQMTHLKNFSDGTDAIDALAVDNLKLDGNTISSTDTNGDITLDPNGTGNVGINTASPAYTIDAASSGNTQIHLKASGQSDGLEIGQLSADGGSAITATNNNYLKFGTNNTERLRLTAGGNLNIGKTADGIGTAGLALRGDVDVAQFTRSGGEALEINRLANDGNLVIFYQGGTNVGSIGNDGNGLYINSVGTGSLFANGVQTFKWDGNQFYPHQDNARDLGFPSFRWDDIYATNGTIQTSDANEKQQIAALTDAEITAAKAISALFKTFKWNSAAEAKGDAARTHAGVIAQDVQQAMTAAGLDAGDYAFFISSTWWETQTDVPAVEAVAEVLDDDGNVVTEAVEAVAAYTRTDTYDTAEEAPEGATERTRLGIRYPELLAFVGAATEQRLANIETRLAALEA